MKRQPASCIVGGGDRVFGFFTRCCRLGLLFPSEDFRVCLFPPPRRRELVGGAACSAGTEIFFFFSPFVHGKKGKVRVGTCWIYEA